MIDKKLLKNINFLNSFESKLELVNKQYQENKGQPLNDQIAQMQLNILLNRLKKIKTNINSFHILVEFCYNGKNYNKEILLNMVHDAHDSISSLWNSLF